ncbi:hypothetical protein BGZ47_006275 [Haplosporangium gracile]|nr:hypothetical protein BGZ47_006275 [Haplosporangium gracile]
MHTAKSLFLSLAPLMVTESLPLILVTVLYEFDIIRYLFFGHPTKPVPPSHRKLDYIGFLPIPEKTKSWQGSLVAVLCGLVWSFSEVTLDIVLIIFGVNASATIKKQIQQNEQQCQYEGDDDTKVVKDSIAEDEAGVKAKRMHSHQPRHHHHRDSYDNSEEFFGDHQPQPQQQQHGGRRWRREFQRGDESAYGACGEGGAVVGQLDLQNEPSVWNSIERSVEYEDEKDVLFVVSAVLSRNLTHGADTNEVQADEGKAVLSSTAPDVVAVEKEGERVAALQENVRRTPAAEIKLLPAQDLERIVDVLSDPDADVDTETADGPMPVSSYPLSSTSTSCTDLHFEAESNKDKEPKRAEGDFTDNTQGWVQLPVSTKTAEAPTLNDCRTTAFIQQHGDGQESAVGVHEHSIEQSQDQWSEWGPLQLSRAVKMVQSTQQQKQGRIVTSPSSPRHIALFPPPSHLAAESTAESLPDDGRIREEKKKALRYAKKKLAKKAKKASGMPVSPTTGGERSLIEDDCLPA